MGTPKPISNLARFGRLVEDSDFDAVIAVSPENVPYTAGVFIWTQRSIRERLAIVVWPKRGEPTFIVCTIEEAEARERSWIKDIRAYVEFKTSPIEALVEVLEEKGLVEGTLGIEKSYLSAAYYNELQERVPRARLEASEELFYKARMVKTPDEIKLMTQAARATEKALLSTFATIQPGDTEKSMALRLSTAMLQCGGDRIKFLYINAGPNSGYPHRLPGAYRAQPGDTIRTDCGAYFSGYISDIARAAVVGSPSEEQRSIYQRLIEIHHETIRIARPGKRACDLFETARQGYAKRHIPFPLPHCGHSLGLDGHEQPILNAFNTTELQPNMLLAIETRVRWPGEQGYHIEDLVQVTEGAPRILSDFFGTEELFVI